MRFTIRDLLWLTALAAVLVAWWLDRDRLIAGHRYALEFEHRKRVQAEEEIGLRQMQILEVERRQMRWNNSRKQPKDSPIDFD